jgi:hypothetical protein
MEDYNFNENAITAPDLLKNVDDGDEDEDLVIAFLDTEYTDNAKVVLLTEDICNYLKSGEKDRDLYIDGDIFGVLYLGETDVAYGVGANVRFNVESGKYEVHVRLGETDMISKKFFRNGKIFDNLEDAVCQK